MNKIVSEGIDVATEAADKITNSKNHDGSGGFPYKTVLLTLGVFALVGYALAQASPSKKRN